ncbi:MAG: SAM-dependent methyltransferase [Pseudomonadota bacterium]|nr:SAM-dependent methyltransferase [Pseudomonadota bacterium]
MDIIDKKIQILEKFGHQKSNEAFSPIDNKGNPVPWFTYPAFEFLENLDFSSKTIFEWGSGNSTLYWSKRCKEIISIDDKEEWTDLVKGAANVTAMNISGEDYPTQILNYDDLDVIIVDGIKRLECSKYAIKKIKRGGMIILDNSDWYVGACDQLAAADDFIQVDFSGFGPINNYCWSTTLFMHRNFSFSRRRTNIPLPTGGLVKNLAPDA